MSNRKHLSTSLAPRQEGIEMILDKFEDRRVCAEQLCGTLCGKQPPSRYPGFYDAEEVDDGRLDPFERTGYVAVDQIPDDHEPYEEEGEEDTREYLVSGKLPPTSTKATPHGPRSRINYARRYYEKLPPLSCVNVIVQGRGLVPYKEVRGQFRSKKHV
jgi:hypothetical protein